MSDGSGLGSGDRVADQGGSGAQRARGDRGRGEVPPLLATKFRDRDPSGLTSPVLDPKTAASLKEALGLEDPKPPRKKALKKVDTLRDDDDGD